MTWRIVIVPDAGYDGVAIQIARRMGDGSVQQLRFEQAAETTPYAPGTAMPAPSLTLADDLAMALLDALADHFGNTSGGRQQRADYEHERGRVDHLSGVLARIAEGAVTVALEPPAHLYAESRPGREVPGDQQATGRRTDATQRG